MGTTNFSKFKDLLEKGKNTKQNNGQKFNWAKLEAGKRHTFRFLPLKNENLELPVTVYNHHALTFPDGHFESVACPHRNGDGECPFCALASKIYRKYTKTEEKKYLEAAKQLFAKQHYLLVGFEPNEIDVANLTSDDFKIVRASSKANIDTINNKLEKGIDFIDPKEGRTVTLLKSKAKGKTDITTVTWDFDDPSPAFTGKSAEKLWNTAIELSPDLTEFVKSPTQEKLMQLFKEYSEAPSVSDDESLESSEFEASRDMLRSESNSSSSSDDGEIDLDALRDELKL